MGVRKWSFTLRGVPAGVTPVVMGDCPSLGSWSPAGAVPMVSTESGDVWSLSTELPSDRDVAYRYATCLFEGGKAAIRDWETAPVPRSVARDAALRTDAYGETETGRGWLTSDTVVQLKFWEPKLGERVHVTAAGALAVDVADLSSEEPRLRPQGPSGVERRPGSLLIFEVTTFDPDRLSLLVDFRPAGRAFVAPGALVGSEGRLSLAVADGDGPSSVEVRCDYLVVRPTPRPLCDAARGSGRWDTTRTGLEAGHRGMGASFVETGGPSVRENTVASLREAASAGADMVEFDVQLSRDLTPVIYHDFKACVVVETEEPAERPETLELPVGELALEKLRKLKVLHPTEAGSGRPRTFDGDGTPDARPFPELASVQEAIDPRVAFDVEIKRGSALRDGTEELEPQLDLNLYLDKILETALAYAGPRPTAFSTFSPDACVALRLKQNRYPVLFLTQGVTERYVGYRDPRCGTVAAAVGHALNSGLSGVVAHTEDLLRDPSQVGRVLDAGLALFCWGKENNDSATIERLKRMGLHAIIFDRFDEHSTKKNKEASAEA